MSYSFLKGVQTEYCKWLVNIADLWNAVTRCMFYLNMIMAQCQMVHTNTTRKVSLEMYGSHESDHTCSKGCGSPQYFDMDVTCHRPAMFPETTSSLGKSLTWKLKLHTPSLNEERTRTRHMTGFLWNGPLFYTGTWINLLLYKTCLVYIANKKNIVPIETCWPFPKCRVNSGAPCVKVWWLITDISSYKSSREDKKLKTMQVLGQIIKAAQDNFGKWYREFEKKSWQDALRKIPRS